MVFKQFEVHDADCAMKVGTDALLLGSWSDVSDARQIIDAGTGAACAVDNDSNLKGMVGLLDVTEKGNLLFWDDVSGQLLKTEKVVLARQEEIA